MSRGSSLEARAGVSARTDRDLVEDMLDPPDRHFDVEPCTPYRHGKLKGQQRCYGCGRTRNEIEIEEGGGHV